MPETETTVYTLVTEKPLPVLAYEVRDFRDDAVDITDDARVTPGSAASAHRRASPPGVVAPTNRSRLTDYGQARLRAGGWIVIRRGDNPTHPLDEGMS